MSTKVWEFLGEMANGGKEMISRKPKASRYINSAHPRVMLCTELYTTPAAMVVAHLTLIGFIIFKISVLLKFYRTMDQFPLKQRAPYLALCQMIPVVFSRIFMYFLEWGRYLEW
jgi:hypothetical protein